MTGCDSAADPNSKLLSVACLIGILYILFVNFSQTT